MLDFLLSNGRWEHNLKVQSVLNNVHLFSSGTHAYVVYDRVYLRIEFYSGWVDGILNPMVALWVICQFYHFEHFYDFRNKNYDLNDFSAQYDIPYSDYLKEITN